MSMRPTHVAKRSRAGAVLAIGLGVLGAFGCGPGAEDQRTDTVTPEVARGVREALDPGLVAQLDSGNVAMRERDPARALGHYRSATRMDPEVAAGWFGVYMAERALGNLEAADQALERARAAEPRASLLVPDSGSEGAPTP